MTTMSIVGETLARFDRKSPRESYKQVCGELGLHVQRNVYALLPEKPNAWHQIQTLELEHGLLGTKGCMALLPLITVSSSLRKMSLRSCGLSDEFVAELCQILQNHPSLRAVDISGNELVTVYSAAHIISVMRNNKNIVKFDVYKTHVGESVAGIIEGLGQKNLDSLLHYYEDRYFPMKNLFNYMDVDGTGWVSLKSLVLNCPFPVLQEHFIERIAATKPRKRSNNTIDINTFLQLVYMNYKTEAEIGRMAEQKLDEPYIFIIANWKQVLHAVKRFNAREDMAHTVALPDDFHRWRLRDYLISSEDADVFVETAVQLLEHAATPTNAAGAAIEAVNAPAAAGEYAELVDPSRESADKKKEQPPAYTSAGTTLHLPIRIVLQAAKSSLVAPPGVVKPTYQFYKDRDVTCAPRLLRDGSRTFSLGGMSALLGGTGSSAGGEETVVTTDVAAAPSDPPRAFALPSSMVRMVINFFNTEAAKLPRQKMSGLPETPRHRRDRAMERTAIPVPVFLGAEFVSRLETVRPRLLGDHYARNALLIEEGTLTLQEMVNVLDEMYVQCRVDRILTLAEVEALPDPMSHAPTASFLSAHLQEREEEVSQTEALCMPDEL